jgi:hypothetical protein
MKLNDSEIVKYRAYILYGRNVENILQRIIAYVNGCINIIADSILEQALNKLCNDKPTIIEIQSYRDVDEIISRSIEGKAVLFMVESPRVDIYAVAFIPVDKFNKNVVRGA